MKSAASHDERLKPIKRGAYLLTWTTHSSWMPGNPRGFVGPVADGYGGWVRHNVLGTPRDEGPKGLSPAVSAERSIDAVVLTHAMAMSVRDSFQQSAADHQIELLAGAVMRTHIHLVARSRSHDVAALLRLFKGASSRLLTLRHGAPARQWWTRHGSRRLLPDPQSVEGAIRYVFTQEKPIVAFGLRYEDFQSRNGRSDG